MERMTEMKRFALKILVLTIVGAVFIVAAAGCQEDQNSKKSKLIADENIQLKDQLGAKDRQNEILNEKIAEQAKKINFLQNESKESIEGLMGEIMKMTADQTKKLNAENVALKAEINALKAGIEKLKQQSPQ